MRSFEANIVEVVQETPDTVTLVLDSTDPPEYRAGQFLTIDPHQVEATRERARQLELLKGKKERVRSYSLASSPHEPRIAITIKSEPDGKYPSLMSPYMVGQAKAGDRLTCTGFAGLYVLPATLPADAHLVHICAGSGIVPNFAIIKNALHTGLACRHTLLDSNRRRADVIFRERLAALATEHPERLRVVHMITREPGAGTHDERIDEPKIRQYVPDLERAWFFICGPSIPPHERSAARARGEAPAPRFMEQMKHLVLSMGVPKERIHYEGW